MTFNIFVSYSHQDARLVTPVVRLLRATKGMVFQDRDSIRPGKRWKRELDHALSEADLIIVFWCVHSLGSLEVRGEYQSGITFGKDLLPILFDSTPVAADLARYQWIDFREVVGDNHESEGTAPSSEPPVQTGCGCLLTAATLVLLGIAAYRLQSFLAVDLRALTLLLLAAFVVLLLTVIVAESRRRLRAPAEAAYHRRMASQIRKEIMSRAEQACD